MPRILVFSYTNAVTGLLGAITHSHRISVPAVAPKQFKVVGLVVFLFVFSLGIFLFKTVTLCLKVT